MAFEYLENIQANLWSSTGVKTPVDVEVYYDSLTKQAKFMIPDGYTTKGAFWEPECVPNLWNGVRRSFSLSETLIDGQVTCYDKCTDFNNTFADSGITGTMSDIFPAAVNKFTCNMDGMYRNCRGFTGTLQANKYWNNCQNFMANTNIQNVNLATTVTHANYYNAFSNCYNINNVNMQYGSGYNVCLDYAFYNDQNIDNLNFTGTHMVRGGNFAFVNAGRKKTTFTKEISGTLNVYQPTISMFENCAIYTNVLKVDYKCDQSNANGYRMFYNANFVYRTDTTRLMTLNNCNNAAFFMANSGHFFKPIGTQQYGWFSTLCNNIGNAYGMYMDAGSFKCAPVMEFYLPNMITDFRYLMNNVKCNMVSWEYAPRVCFRTCTSNNFDNLLPAAHNCFPTTIYGRNESYHKCGMIWLCTHTKLAENFAFSMNATGVEMCGAFSTDNDRSRQYSIWSGTHGTSYKEKFWGYTGAYIYGGGPFDPGPEKSNSSLLMW